MLELIMMFGDKEKGCKGGKKSKHRLRSKEGLDDRQNNGGHSW